MAKKGVGNLPGQDIDGSRSFRTFTKRTRRPIPQALFARPINTEKYTPEKYQDHSAHLSRNKKLAFIIAATHSVGFFTPIWVIFGTDHLGLSLFASLVLGSTGWVTSAIFEVPLGAFSDKYGRKLSVMLGLALCAIGDLSLAAFNNFWMLMAFQVVSGMGFAMRSGSLEALLHDTYEASGELTAYSSLSSKMSFLTNASRIFTVPIGAWLYELDVDAKLSSYTFPYLASSTALLTALSASFFLIEKRSQVSDDQPAETGRLASRIWTQTRESWSEMMGNPVVKRVTIILGLDAFLGEGSWALYQEYFRDRNIALVDSSWIYTGVMFLMALGSLYVARIYRRLNVVWGMVAIIALMATDLVIMHFPLYLALVGIAITAFISSMSWYLQDNAIQNRMSGNRKATALSIASMLYNIGAMIGIFGGGAVADALGVTSAMWYFSLYGLVVCALLAWWCRSFGFTVLPEDARATGTSDSDESLSGESDETGPITPFDDVPQLKP